MNQRWSPKKSQKNIEFFLLPSTITQEYILFISLYVCACVCVCVCVSEQECSRPQKHSDMVGAAVQTNSTHNGRENQI